STDYDNFSCDHGTGMETQAKFADTIYSRGGDDLFVNLFIPSEVSWPERNLVLRQENAFPDEASSRLVMTSADGPLTLRVRVPSWVDGPPRVLLNGEKIRHTARPGSWLTLRRQWRAGDTVDLSLPMSVKLNPTPDDPDLQAVTVGPIVLCGDYGDQAMMPTPRLDTTSVRRTIAKPMTFTAKADGQDVSLMPISRMHHRHHTAYWRTGAPPPPPPPFAAWYRFDETRGTTATDSSGHRKKARLVGGTSWTTGRIGGAVQLNGEDGHVQLPGVLSGATEYSVATWVRLDALPAWAPIFCFGVGTTAHMFLNANSSENTMCYTISARGYDGGQRIDAAVLPIGSWHHVAVTHGDGIGVLYVDGAEVGRNTAMPVQPRWFGSEIKQSYLGRSAFETYLPGALDDFRIYGRVLSPSEVGSLAAG
ncbi:MAG: uncharacterized protein QOF58_7579, partial [Pseudonocardiales bacterium]|nr:uncharacterized protein [Pseudonocardiales bacterium]